MNQNNPNQNLNVLFLHFRLKQKITLDVYNSTSFNNKYINLQTGELFDIDNLTYDEIPNEYLELEYYNSYDSFLSHDISDAGVEYYLGNGLSDILQSIDYHINKNKFNINFDKYSYNYELHAIFEIQSIKSFGEFGYESDIDVKYKGLLENLIN